MSLRMLLRLTRSPIYPFITEAAGSVSHSVDILNSTNLDEPWFHVEVALGTQWLTST